MSGTAKMRRLPRSAPAPKVTVWREALNRTLSERQRYWAVRYGRVLVVQVSRIDGDRVRVIGRCADVQPMVWLVVASEARADAEKIAAAVAVAKQWAEKRADDIAAGASR